MPDLSLDDRLKELQSTVAHRIEGLQSHDPMKNWFSLELERLAPTETSDNSLDDTNARIQATRQLAHLLFQHCVRLKNPEHVLLSGDTNASVLTIEARIPQNVLQTAREMRFSIEPTLLHERPSENEDYDPVSPTAKVVGYLRGLDRSLKITDEFSLESEGRELMQTVGIADPPTQTAMAVLFQSRYHAINVAMAGEGDSIKQVAEFAAGISPRGFQWSRLSPGTIYIESDLPQLMVHKAKLVRNAILETREKRLGLMHCCAADVLDLESVHHVLGTLDTQQPFTMVTEGLLLYFGDEELHRFMANIGRLLREFPQSTWITDFVSQSNLRDLLDSDPGVADGVRNVFRLTQRDVVPNNPLMEEDCIQKLLDSYDLRVQSTVALADVCGNLEFEIEFPVEKRKKIVGSRKIWRIRSKA